MSVLNIVFLGTFIVTSYQSIKSQTDCNPYYTSINERVNMHGVAVSQDWLCSKAKTQTRGGFRLCKRGRFCSEPQKLHYHDWIYIEGVGIKNVNDVMHPKHKKHFDVWVGSYKQEKEFDKKFRNKKLHVYIIKGVNCEL